MPQESDLAGPLDVWVARLQQKVNMLEKASKTAQDRQRLFKEFATCETYWKKISVRARDLLFSTAQGDQIARDLAHIREQLTLVRGILRLADPGNPLSWEPLL